MRSASITGDPLAARDERGGELDLSAIARALWAKKLRIVAPTIVALIAAVLVVQTLTPQFKSTATILLRSGESAFTRPVGEQRSPDQQVIDEQAVASQVQLLRSPDLARRVLEDLDVEGNPELDPLARGLSPLQRVLMVLGLANTSALEKSGTQRALEAFEEALTIYPMAKSRVIAVEFDSRDPELAARVANGLADTYIAMQGDLKRGDSRGASEALSSQIDELRLKVTRAEEDVEAFRSANGLFLSQNNATLTTQQLGDINTQLSAARAQQAEARAKADLIRNLLNSGRPLEVSEITNNELIRRLVEQRVNLGAQLALESRTLLAAHPRIKELNAQLSDLQSQIVGEARRTVRSLENDAAISGARVKSLANQLDFQKAELAASNEQEVKLRALEREAKSQRDLLESYLSRFREASSRASLQDLPADARIVSRAMAATNPFFPKKGPIILIVTMIALVGSIAFVVAGELLSERSDLPGTLPRTASPAMSAAVPPVAVRAQAAMAPAPMAPAPMAPGYDPAVHHRLAMIMRSNPPIASAGGAATGLPEIEPAPILQARAVAEASAAGQSDAPVPASTGHLADDSPACVTDMAEAATPRTAPEPAAGPLDSSDAADAVPEQDEDAAEAAGPPAGRGEPREFDAVPEPAMPSAEDEEAMVTAAIAPSNGCEAPPARIAGVVDLLRGRAEAARTILFSGPGGAYEISETASACARALAEGTLRVILIAGQTGADEDGNDMRGLGDLLAGEASFVDVINRDRYSRLHLISGGCPTEHVDDDIVTERAMVVFDALSSTYDAIVFDAGSLNGLVEPPVWAPFLGRCEICALVMAEGSDEEDARQALADWGARKILAVEPASDVSLVAA
jgi:polysaccharide biosynthesis transport protein